MKIVAAAAAELNHIPSRIQYVCIQCASRSDHRSTQSTVHIHILLSIGFSIVRFFHISFFNGITSLSGSPFRKSERKREIEPWIK